MDMDKDHFTDQPEDDSWLDEILGAQEGGAEILPDEAAMADAGLTHPDDLELTRIIESTKAEFTESESVPDAAAAPDVPPEEPFRDEEYRETFGEGMDLEEMFSNGDSDTDGIPPLEPATPLPELDAPAPDSKKPQRKGRPKHKKGYGLLGIPHLMVTVVWLAIAVMIGVTLGRFLWVCAADLLAFGRESQDITITITENDDLDSIATKLKDAGLIEYPELFKLFVDIKGAEDEISTGTFTLNTKLDYNALVNSMAYYAPGREVVTVMVPEGYTCAQTFRLLEEKGVCSAADLEAYAASGELDEYWFLEGVERGDKYCLEGYLFPDTYQFYTNDDPERVLEKFLDAFDMRFTADMKERLVTLNERFAQMLANNGYSQEYIDAHPITVREVVIIASMVEKETAHSGESYTISSVIYNRLASPNFPYLNIDATLIYALNGNIDPETGNTKPLTESDLQMDHPYNTYNHEGLIPGPISNPGKTSLLAALVPEETDYYYYALNPNTGEHHFSRTYNEQQAFLNSLG